MPIRNQPKGTPEQIEAALKEAALAEKKADEKPTITCLPLLEDGERRPYSEVHYAADAQRDVDAKHKEARKRQGLPT